MPSQPSQTHVLNCTQYKSINKCGCTNWLHLDMKNGRPKSSQVSMAEWLRRQTRNLLGFPAQVQILLLTFFTFSPPFNAPSPLLMHLPLQIHLHITNYEPSYLLPRVPTWASHAPFVLFVLFPALSSPISQRHHLLPVLIVDFLG